MCAMKDFLSDYGPEMTSLNTFLAQSRLEQRLRRVLNPRKRKVTS
jgi:hypothetical protein